MTHDNVTDIVERLGWHHEHPVTGALVLRNHDGPEAAAEIERLRSDITRQMDIANEHVNEAVTLRKQLENARSEALEEAAKVSEEVPIIGPTLRSWIDTNESPMGATRRHIATAIRALKGKS